MHADTQENEPQQFLDEYSKFCAELEQALAGMTRLANIDYCHLKYAYQLGKQAGSYLKASVGEKPHGKDSLKTIPLDYLFDRPLGELLIGKSGAAWGDAQMEPAWGFCRWACLTSYALRNEYSNSLIKNAIRPMLVSNDVTNQEYARLAGIYRKAMSASGLIIWHVCMKNKVEGQYQLAEIDISKPVTEGKFLHVLGASPYEQVDMELTDGVAASVLTRGLQLRIDDLWDKEEVRSKTGGGAVVHENVVKNNHWRSGIFLPLKLQERVVGVIGAYTSRVAGFNNLDETIVNRCAEQITAYFLIHRSTQQNRVLMERIAELGKEVSAAQYTVFGSVHDAINISKDIRDHIDYVTPTKETMKHYQLLQDQIGRNAKVLEKLRTNIRSPKALPVKFEKVRLKSFVENQLRALRVEAGMRKIALDVTKVPDLEVQIDIFRLSQVLYNLVINSIRHFGNVQRPRKIINVRAEDLGTQFRISVEDNGPGIAPEIKNDIFEPFTSTSGGMGMGLSIVKTFVEEMAGEVEVETQWGRYAMFALTFRKKV